MKYMLFIKHTEDYRAQMPPRGLMDAMDTFVGIGLSSGALVDTAGLKATSQAKKVRLQGGRLSVIDGPFTESKEVIGGYALIDVKSDQMALDLATEFMELHRVHWPEFNGECEMRPLEDFDAPPGSA
ncbi:MAG: YciI family protein [Gemmatimonadota bacterium]|nr:YciI family protein [Gemmatimonadota bacterium]